MSFAIERYEVASVETLSPARLLVLLYDGAIKATNQAADAVRAGDHGRKARCLSKAHAIVTELRLTLDREHAPAISDELDRLYGFVLDQLTAGGAAGEPKKLEAASSILGTLREAWDVAAREGV